MKLKEFVTTGIIAALYVVSTPLVSSNPTIKKRVYPRRGHMVVTSGGSYGQRE